jgi:cytoskeletal protein CcmA (bactofilin family)
MLHSNDNAPKTQYTPSTLNPVTPMKSITSPVEQATIGRSVVIKGEVSGNESLYIDGRIEGSLTFKDHRVTVGRNGVVSANISAREVVIMGKVTGNIECSDRVDIRSEGSLTGDIQSRRISVEDGALLRGSVQLIPAEHKQEKPSAEHKQEKSPALEAQKALAAGAGK